MQSAEATNHRRIVVLLEPGDEVIGAIAEACRAHLIAQASITTFSGALRSATIIAGREPAADPELPLPDSVEVSYVEGIGSGMVTTGTDGEIFAHVHVALGAKDAAGAAVAGHLLRAEVQYTVEIVLDEIVAPALIRGPRPGTSGVPVLMIAPIPRELRP